MNQCQSFFVDDNAPGSSPAKRGKLSGKRTKSLLPREKVPSTARRMRGRTALPSVYILCFLLMRSGRAGPSFCPATKGCKNAFEVHTKHTGRVCHATGRASGGNIFDRRQWRMQGENGGRSGRRWPGGVSAAGRAGNRKRASASTTTCPVPLCAPPHARNKNRAVTPNLLHRRK